MAIKKSELYSSLWVSCKELRGGMDASYYKDSQHLKRIGFQ
ncbi:MAG: SAM-dependent DNA methyltransferase [Candidatus Cloacimonetes bacterium]|nr:SAM-dependent DNA methyltransferase [Candidatus Cloacimonadota bacterium]